MAGKGMTEDIGAKLITVIEEWAPTILWDSEEYISSRMAETNSLFDDFNYEDIEIEKVTDSQYNFFFNLTMTGEPRKDDVPFCGNKINAKVKGNLDYDEDTDKWEVSYYEVLGAEVEGWHDEYDSEYWSKPLLLSAQELIAHLSELSEGFWFRGHSDCNWELKPSIARVPNASLILENNLRLEFENQTSFISPHTYPLSLEASYFLMQHHGLPTRLLDWSRSPLIALYFAIFDKEYDSNDACVFVLDPSQLNRFYKNEFPLICDEKWFKENNEQSVGIHSPYTNLRMKVQQSEFTLHANYNALDALPGASFIKEKILINKKIKEELRKRLSTLGIDRSTLFPDHDNIAKTIKDNMLE